MYCSMYYEVMITFFIEMLVNLLQKHTSVMIHSKVSFNIRLVHHETNVRPIR